MRMYVPTNPSCFTSTATTPPLDDSKSQAGFTLIELMVVIVILAVFAGMMGLSVSGSDSRKNMAFFEHLQSNLRYVRLLSSEQMQPYGMAIKLAQNDTPNQLVIVKLTNAYSQSPTGQLTLAPTANSPTNQLPTWVIDNHIPPLDVPKSVEVKVQPLDNIASLQNTPSAPPWLTGNQAPPVVWFGTGEATPVQIMVQKNNPDNKIFAIGNPIIINQAGAIEVAK